MKLTVGREYDCKLEICKQSNIVTLTKYHKSVKSDLAKNFGTRFKETTEEQYQENKKKNIRKSASRIIKLVKHNVGQYKKANGKKFPPIYTTFKFIVLCYALIKSTKTHLLERRSSLQPSSLTLSPGSPLGFPQCRVQRKEVGRLNQP